MARIIYPTVNWYSGQQVNEQDLIDDQTAFLGTTAQAVDLIEGSGVEQDTPSPNVIFSTATAPASIQNLITGGSFDGTPIYPTDTFGNTVITQPSDQSQGNQLQLTISGSSLTGSASLNIYIFGINFSGSFVQEVITFKRNGTQITRNYFLKVVAIMSQNFLGNTNTTIDGTGSRDVGGQLLIVEAQPLVVAWDTIMASQTNYPDINYTTFKPANASESLQSLLNQIAASDQQSSGSLGIATSPSSTRTLGANASTGIIVGEKFLATTNNIQKVTILLAVNQNVLALPGDQFDFSGNIVVGIRALQTSVTCPTDTIPGNAIDFDPEPSSLAEISLNQAQMAQQGVILNATPQPVDFVFTQSPLANPNLNNGLIPGNYYVVTISRSGDISTGDVVLTEAADQIATAGLSTQTMKETVFSDNVWTDIDSQDLWFKVWTDAIRITSGTAIEAGVQISSPKIQENLATGTDYSFIDGSHSFVDTSFETPNYVIVQENTVFLDPTPQPATGDLIATRKEEIANAAVLSQASLLSLINANTNPVVLGSIEDTNPVGLADVSGTSIYPGLATKNTFTLIAPSLGVLNTNFVGAILTPNTNAPQYTYRITSAQVFNDAYGDVNGDGTIDINDVVLVQALDGYSNNFNQGTVPPTTQQAAIQQGTITIEQILRGDVDANGVINIVDAQDIQTHISLNTPFPAGVAFTRVLITVENTENPLTTTPDIIGNDPTFNAYPFTSIPYAINFQPIWEQENLIITDLRRFVPKTFTSITAADITGTPPNGGSNSEFFPGNLILGGAILNSQGNTYSIDLEVASVVLELPAGSTAGYVDVFNSFIRNTLKFYDGTLVSGTALANNQVFVTAALESIAKDYDSLDPVPIDNNTAIDETVSLLYTNSTGILTIRADNIRNILTRPELRTKVVLTVYLKKAGFQNPQTTISSTQLTSVIVPIT